MKIRKRDFDFSHSPKLWFSHSPFAVYFFNSFSLIIPKGEAFFMRSVTLFSRQMADPAMKIDASIFVAQEANHTQAHDNLNRWIESSYHISDRFHQIYDKLLHFYIFRSPRHQLVCTMCLEYLTYIFSRIVLKKDLMQTADPELRNFWYWHALEEIDHKSVAFVLCDRLEVSYLRRCATLLLVLQPLFIMLFYGIYIQARQDRRLNVKGIFDALRFFAVKEKFLLHFGFLMLPFFWPWHRPEAVDDRSYLEPYSELDISIEQGSKKVPAA